MNLQHKKTLRAALKYAEAHGWKRPIWYPAFNISRDQSERLAIACLMGDHEFAKALWPGWNLSPEAAKFLGKEPRPRYYDFLQQWIIAPDPFAYLAEHLPREDA